MTTTGGHSWGEDHRPVAVIGVGLMGHRIAQVFAAAGHSVRVWDADGDAVRSVGDRIAANLRSGGVAEDEVVAIVARVDGCPTLAQAVAGTQLVVEAVFESPTIKQPVLQAVEEAAPADALLCTNTSVLPLSSLSGAMAEPGRLCGLHWWNPADVVPLVEVVAGESVDPVSVRRLVHLMVRLGKIPVVLGKDSPGYVGNRLQVALWREALALVEEGVCDPETIDVVVRSSFGLRLGAMGPMEQIDYIGLDLTQALLTHIGPHLSSADGPPAVLTERVGAGEVGARSGSGFASWPPGRREDAARRLDAAVRRAVAGR